MDPLVIKEEIGRPDQRGLVGGPVKRGGSTMGRPSLGTDTGWFVTKDPYSMAGWLLGWQYTDLAESRREARESLGVTLSSSRAARRAVPSHFTMGLNDCQRGVREKDCLY